MTLPAEMASVIIICGFGIATGITLLYNRIVDPACEKNSHEESTNLSQPCRRRLPSESPDQQLSPERFQRRAISPPREAPRTQNSASTFSRCRNRVPHPSGQTTNCEICTRPMRNSLITLRCGHIFHDDCLTIWRHAVVTQNPQAKLCPSC